MTVMGFYVVMITINEILKGVDKPDLAQVSETLDEQATPLALASRNWIADSYKPKVIAYLGYNDAELFLKFVVEEESIRAIYTENNSKVSKDSCCELFISPDASDCYYNFEFSCISTLLMGYRKMGESAIRPNVEVMESVRWHSSLGNQPFEVKIGNFT
jgi:hypothetical protein